MWYDSVTMCCLWTGHSLKECIHQNHTFKLTTAWALHACKKYCDEFWQRKGGSEVIQILMSSNKVWLLLQTYHDNHQQKHQQRAAKGATSLELTLPPYSQHTSIHYVGPLGAELLERCGARLQMRRKKEGTETMPTQNIKDFQRHVKT